MPPLWLSVLSEFARALRLGLVLSAVALAAGCGTTQSALPFVPADAPLRFSTYLNSHGELRGEDWALVLMGHPAHREQVFLQARQGLFPASEAWFYLEAVCRGAGAIMAQEHARTQCTMFPGEAGCEFNWQPVSALIPGTGPGRDRLTDVYKQGYDERWEQLRRGFQLRSEIVRAGTLMAAPLLGRTPAAAEGRTTAAESGASVAEGRALSAESRALAAESEVAGARATSLLSAESLGLGRALSAEEASALESRLLELEAEAPGKREAFSSAELRNGTLTPRPKPSDLNAEGSLRWDEFEAYRQRRLQEVRSQKLGGANSLSVKPPLRWEAYRDLLNHFQRCYQFESRVGGTLLQELEQSAGSRRVLTGSRQPLLARHVGTTKVGQEGVHYPDYLAVDEATLKEGSVPRVETVSVKMRNFSKLSESEVRDLVQADLQEAMNKYGGRLEVRRPGHPLYGRTVQVSQIHLAYSEQSLGTWRALIEKLCQQARVKVHFE
ncbi:hypothetical protein [Hyalangium versicolor]|uniref:hypothetical protein n=1 Tax=Hyalangium versicolor TaxID=2861190 RepID=UPI001CCE49EC|nr:hypothetical protein [Hyalangium versicolor]